MKKVSSMRNPVSQLFFIYPINLQAKVDYYCANC
jgi:hypothetical protein